MLRFLKKLFEEAEEKPKTVPFNELEEWLKAKTNEATINLQGTIASIISQLKEEIRKAKGSIETLRNAELKNPKIPHKKCKGD